MAYFVTIRDNGWAVIKSGAQRAIKVFETQKEAIEFAKSLAKNKIQPILFKIKMENLEKANYTPSNVFFP